MNTAQKLRRFYNRMRRRIIGGVDNEPIVEIEGGRAPEKSPATLGLRVRHMAGRWLRTVAAFVGTLAVFALIYGLSVAWRERVVLPRDPPRAAAPETGSKAVAVAASLLAIDVFDPGREAWFAPAARKRRILAFQAGAAEAVAAFVEVVERRRRGRDKDLSLASAALTDPQPDMERFAAARDALRRFNARAGKKGPPIDRGQRGMAALAREASAGVASHARALEAVGDGESVGALTDAAEEEFYRARGNAYAWRLLLAAYGEDLPPKAHERLAPAVSAAQTALGAAAGFEPLVLMKPPFTKEGPLTALASRLGRAAPQTRILAEAAEALPPAKP